MEYRNLKAWTATTNNTNTERKLNNANTRWYILLAVSNLYITTTANTSKSARKQKYENSHFALFWHLRMSLKKYHLLILLFLIYYFKVWTIKIHRRKKCRIQHVLKDRKRKFIREIEKGLLLNSKWILSTLKLATTKNWQKEKVELNWKRAEIIDEKQAINKIPTIKLTLFFCWEKKSQQTTDINLYLKWRRCQLLGTFHLIEFLNENTFFMDGKRENHFFHDGDMKFHKEMKIKHLLHRE